MKKQVSIMLAAGLLMAEIPAATAAMQSPSGSATMPQPLGDTLDLTATQRTKAWNDLQKQATEPENAVQLRADARVRGPEHDQDQAGTQQSRERRSAAQVLCNIHEATGTLTVCVRGD